MAELFQNYGSWLLIGALMFFMMRRGGCCGGHSSHGGHTDQTDHADHSGRGINGHQDEYGNHRIRGGQDLKPMKGGDSMSHCCGENEKSAILNVEGMSCGHCKAAVEKAVSALDGVSKVEVDLNAKKVSITYDSAKVTEESFRKAITDQGYQVA